MSGRRHKSTRATSKRGQQRDSVATGRSAEDSKSRSISNWWLVAFLGVISLIAVGSYPWLNIEPAPTIPAAQPARARQAPGDIYRRALSVDPENHGAHYNLGLLLQSQGKLDEAIAHYRQAIAIAGNEAGPHNNLGAALARQGKLAAAITEFNFAIQCDPNHAEARFNLGNALFSQENLVEAIEQYRRAIQLKPDYARAHNNLSVALKKSGNLQEAYQHQYEAMRLKRAKQDDSFQEPVKSE